MKAALLRSYLKYRYKVIILWIVAIIIADWSTRGDLLVDLIFPAIFILRELYHFPERLEKIKRLKAKGLTEKDLLNIEFVKKWDDTRSGGIWKYCIMYGAIIGGFGLSLVLSLLYATLYARNFKGILANPGPMFRFIGINYIIGAITGVILFRILWFFKERRFMRLTDPVNTIFVSKRISFNDPL